MLTFLVLKFYEISIWWASSIYKNMLQNLLSVSFSLGDHFPDRPPEQAVIYIPQQQAVVSKHIAISELKTRKKKLNDR